MDTHEGRTKKLSNRDAARFVVKHNYAERRNGKVLPALADRFLRLELRDRTTDEEAQRIAHMLNARVTTLAVTRFMSAVNDRPF